MGHEYELAEKNSGHVKIAIPISHSKPSNNSFITENFCERAIPLHTSEVPLLDQLSRVSTEEGLSPATTFGTLKSTFVDESCYIRPGYLRFAPNSTALPSLRTLLCEKWLLKPPPLLINVFGTYKKKNRSQKERVRKIVEFAEQSSSWFMATDKTDANVAYCSLEIARKTASSRKNIVFCKPWGDLSEKEKEDLTPPTYQAGRVHCQEWNSVDDHTDLKMTKRQSACVLFPDIINEEDKKLADHLTFIKEFAKAFDKDGHEDMVSDLQLHVCSPINFFLPQGDITDMPEEERVLFAELISSGIPTVIVADSVPSRVDLLVLLEGRLPTEINKKTLRVSGWVSDAPGANSFTDLATGVRDLLVESRKDGLSKKVASLFSDKMFTKLYLNHMFGLDEECRQIIRDETAKGTQEGIISMTHFYRRTDLLDECIQNNYNMKACLYNTGILMKKGLVSMLVNRSRNFITKGIAGKVEDIADTEKRKSEERLFLGSLNKLVGNSDMCYTDPDNNAHKIDIDDAQYLFYCFNQEWEMAKLLRKYSDFPIFKCLLAIKAIQKMLQLSSNSADECFDAREMGEQIKLLDEEAGDIVAYSFKKGINTGPVVFWEHSKYAYKSIMDLAGETGHYKVLEDRTNMAMHITKRWNGALDCTTSTIRIMFSWLTLGLIAPLLMKFVPQDTRRDETALFLHEKKSKKGYWKKVAAFWKSSRSKCYLLMITYLVFLGLLTILVLDNTRAVPKADEQTYEQSWVGDSVRLNKYTHICLVFVLCFLAVEIDFSQVTRYNAGTRIKFYLNDGYNKVDLFSAITFLLYWAINLVLPGNENAFFVAKVILSISYIGYIVRFTQFMQLFENIGPKLISIKNMVSDLVFFASFLLITIFAYGIVSEFLLHPYPRSVPGNQLHEILKRPYVNMFGELDLDTLEGGIETGVCKYEEYLKGTTREEAYEICEAGEYTCGTKCANFKLIARILLGIYTMLTVILLTNLLVSIFGKTYDTDYEETRQLWLLQRYKLVKESESQFILPFPPFNMLHSIYRIYKACPCCHQESSLYYEQYVKELEYRCGRKMYSADQTGDSSE